MMREIKNKYGTIYEADCLEVMPLLPDKSIDLILCDLPYGTTQNKWDSIIPLDKLFEQYKRLLKNNGVVVLTSQGVFTAKLILAMESWFKYKLVWVKSKATNFLNSKKQPLRQHEDVCVFCPDKGYYSPLMYPGDAYDKGVRKEQPVGSYGDFGQVQNVSDGLRHPTDVIYSKTPESEYDGIVYHPTQKPIDLGRYLIRSYCPEDGIVLDNAFGSGSFLVASAIEKRKFIGIEKNKQVEQFKKNKIDCIDILEKRLELIETGLYDKKVKTTPRNYNNIKDALDLK